MKLSEVAQPRKTLRYGVTEVDLGPKKVVIAHGGNMGASFGDVEKNIDVIFKKKGTGRKLRAMGVEAGSPDYMYTLTLSRKDFDEIVYTR